MKGSGKLSVSPALPSPPREYSSVINWAGRLFSLRVERDRWKKRNISCPWRESNSVLFAVPPVDQSLYQMSYYGSRYGPTIAYFHRLLGSSHLLSYNIYICYYVMSNPLLWRMKLHQTNFPGQFEALSLNVYIIKHKIPVHCHPKH